MIREQPTRLSHEAGQTIGTWALTRFIRRGGNSEVWEGQKSGMLGAVKILDKERADDKTLERFRREATALDDLRDEPGVMRLIDAYVPPKLEDGIAFIVMPVAIPIKEAQGPDPPLEKTVSAIRSVADTLTRVARRGYHHRDLKPSNLFFLDNEWIVGDFGLVEFPEAADLTSGERLLGSQGYMAPEIVERWPGWPDIDYEKSDVYALGKLFWELATQSARPYSGEHRLHAADGTFTKYFPDHIKAYRLDILLQRMTSRNPEGRPTMAEVEAELTAWLAPPPPLTSPLDISSLSARLADVRGHLEARRAQQEAERKPWEQPNQKTDLEQRLVQSLRPIHEYLASNPPFQPVETTGGLGVDEEICPVPKGTTFAYWIARGIGHYQERWGTFPAEIYAYIAAHVFTNNNVSLAGLWVVADNSAGRRQVIWSRQMGPVSIDSDQEAQIRSALVRQMMEKLPDALRVFLDILDPPRA